MKVFQREQNIRCIEPSSVLLEATDLRQIEEELSTWAVLKHEKELRLRLECVVHLNNKGMPHRTLKNC